MQMAHGEHWHLGNYGHVNETFNNPDWYETNPLLPANDTSSLVKWKIGSTIILGIAAHVVPHKWRKPILGGANICVWGCIINDINVGVAWRW